MKGSRKTQKDNLLKDWKWKCFKKTLKEKLFSYFYWLESQLCIKPNETSEVRLGYLRLGLSNLTQAKLCLVKTDPWLALFNPN